MDRLGKKVEQADTLHGVRKEVSETGQPLVDSHEIRKGGQSSESRASVATALFQIKVFFSDTMAYFRELINREVSTGRHPVCDNLTKLNMNVKWAVRSVMELSSADTPVENLRLHDYSDAELNRIHRNIERLRNANGQNVLEAVKDFYATLATHTEDNELKEHYLNLSTQYGRAATLLNSIENLAIEILKQRINGYEPKITINKIIDNETQNIYNTLTKLPQPISGSFKGKLPGTFSANAFKYCLTAPKGDSETIPWILDTKTNESVYWTKDAETGRMIPGKTESKTAKNMVVCEQVGKDIERMSFGIIDKDGNENKFSIKDYPVFKEEEKEKLIQEMKNQNKTEDEINAAVKQREEETNQERAQCSERRVTAFLKLCGYDQEVTYKNEGEKNKAKQAAEEKLFKLSQFMSQTLGSGFEFEHMLGKTSPQVLSNGDRFNIPDQNAKRELNFIIKENKDNSISFEMVTKFTEIKKLHRFELGGLPEPADPHGSYYEQRVGIVFRDGEWEEYKDGYLEYNVNLLPPNKDQT